MLNQTFSCSTWIWGRGGGRAPHFGQVVRFKFVIEEWQHLHSISKNHWQISLKIKNNFFRLTSRIHVEMSFIKMSNSGVKRHSVTSLLLNDTEVSVLTYIPAKPDSDTGSRKMLFWKTEMVKHYRNYNYLIKIDFCIVSFFPKRADYNFWSLLAFPLPIASSCSALFSGQT